MTLEISATVAGQHTGPITFGPEELEFVAKAGKALRQLGTDATRVASGPADKPRRGELPPALLDRFHQHRGSGDKHQWQIGQDVDDAIIEYAGKFTAEKIIKAAVKEMEISRGQVRKCRETWAATDEHLRDEFDVLTFEHFAVLRFIGDRAKMHAYLALAVESAELYGGRPMPAVILAKRVQKDLGLEPPPPTFGELLERALTAVTNLRDAADSETRVNKVAAVLALLEKVN